jgi:hypothetical protein
MSSFPTRFHCERIKSEPVREWSWLCPFNSPVHSRQWEKTEGDVQGKLLRRESDEARETEPQ